MERGFFLIQHVDLEQYGQRISKASRSSGTKCSSGQCLARRLKSRFYASTGETLDYVYELEGDTLTIWGGEKDSPAYYTGAPSAAGGDTLSGAWHYPGGGGYEAISTRVE
jgi:hypothetical protein